VRGLLGIFAFLLLSFPALAESRDIQDTLLDVSVHLVRDIQNLEKRVTKLEEENRRLRQEMEKLKKMVCSCPQKQTVKRTVDGQLQVKRKIIVGTFREENGAKLFVEQFFKRTGYRAQFKQTECKTLGKCYVAYVEGDRATLQSIRKLGYRDAFFARTDLEQKGTGQNETVNKNRVRKNSLALHRP